ncbi:MAG: multidrug efflux SMR transporter [Deltaproteobacteria bacterium]|nr:MAG: multidrug efflux SMR transporter [Deltaproteobacteria bacterium]
MSPWFAVVIAGLLEIAWAIGLKHSEGFSRPSWTAFTLIALAVSFWLLSRAVEQLPLGTAYAVWVGIGAGGTALFGMLAMGEAASLQRMGWVVMLIVSIIGLKASGH